MHLHVARSIGEFDEIISSIKSEEEEIWFRGHSRADYALEPTLYRHKKTIHNIGEKTQSFRVMKGKFIFANDLFTIEAFKKHYINLQKKDELDTIEYLYIMQHYGILTRLLDFTSDENVGLYFAVSENKTIDEDYDPATAIKDFEDTGSTEFGAAIYCFNPTKLNKETYTEDIVFDVTKKDRDFIASLDLPVAIRTQSKNERIVAQKGVFVLFGSWVNCLESYYPIKKMLHKILIPQEYKKAIYNALKLRGIKHSTIFPDMFGIAKELNEDMLDGLEESYNEIMS
jgi:hypothetical protein